MHDDDPRRIVPTVRLEPDVRVERNRASGYALVSNEEPLQRVLITDRQAQQIVDGLAALGIRASS
jgi:hypothetical protein